MTIDIIDLTEPPYNELNPLQLAMVREAQAEKDGILEKAAAEKEKVFLSTLSHNVARSSARTAAEQEIDERAEAAVETVREDLKYRLAYKNWQWSGNESGPYSYPDNPNYDLSASQRFLVVQTYYMGVTSDPNARLIAYRDDTLARAYLGEFYTTLYDLLASYC